MRNVRLVGACAAVTVVDMQAPDAAAGAAPAGMAGQAHGYIEKAEGLLGQLKGKAGGKFDGFLGMADSLLHKVRSHTLPESTRFPERCNATIISFKPSTCPVEARLVIEVHHELKL